MNKYLTLFLCICLITIVIISVYLNSYTIIKENYTNVGKQLHNQDTLLTIDDNGNFNSIGFPDGIIIAWYNSTVNLIPHGWSICDGKNGTPDLRGRFINMATLNTIDDPSSEKTKTQHNINDIGGSDYIEVDTQNLPPHDHPYVFEKRNNDGMRWNNEFSSHFIKLGDGPYTLDAQKKTTYSEQKDTLEKEINTPPYHTLIYLMKNNNLNK